LESRLEAAKCWETAASKRDSKLLQRMTFFLQNVEIFSDMKPVNNGVVNFD
jgi:hypothetical protein